MYKNKKGQVWVETVTYTLIAFVLIGLILGYARPKIQEYQDQAVIEQSIILIKQIDSIIREVSDEGVGNKRRIEFTLKGGELIISPENNSITFYYNDANYMFSQPGYKYNESGMQILTTQVGKKYNIQIEKIYSNLDLVVNDKTSQKTISKSTTMYSLYIENKGGNPKKINFELD